MIELAQHIEALLVENNCVIIPGFGGFIAHDSAARYIREEGLFLPPIRIIGFNPQLKMNDGLLVQSYMQAYNTNFPDATRLVDKAVGKLLKMLQEEGEVELHGIGRLNQTIDDTVGFQPNEDGVMTPGLYGLSSFEISELRSFAVPVEEKQVSLEEELQPKKVYEIRINRSLLRHSVAAAVAIVFFFFMSTPVENTYIEKENYARLFSTELFESFHFQPQSVTTAGAKKEQSTKNVSSKQASSQTQHKTTNLAPKSVRTEKIEKTVTVATEKTSTPSTGKVIEPENKKATSIVQTKGHCIIVASVVNQADAQKLVDSFKKQGYTDAAIIEGNNRVRVSLMTFPDQTEAYKKLNSLKQEPAFKDAWILSTK